MNLEVLAAQATKTINSYKENKIIMDFVTMEARNKVALEIRTKTGSGTTAKAVELLEMRHESIKNKVDNYINIGLIGCYMASLKN